MVAFLLRKHNGEFMFEIAYKTYAGAIKEHNEDTIFVNGEIYNEACSETENDCCLLAVFDGVGGEASGEVASKIAAESLLSYNNVELSKELVNEYVAVANKEIFYLQRSDIKLRNMATTFVLLYLNGDDVICANLGDSEAYRYRTGMLYAISENHSLDSLMSFERNEKSHIIAKYLGGKYIEPSYFDGCNTLSENDLFLLFSDGISDAVSKKEMKKLINEAKNLKALCEGLCELAIKNGTQDNISVIAVRRKNG